MAVFYLLPPRPILGERFAAFLESLLPGLAWDAVQRSQLAELLGSALADRPDIFVVYREDLPQGEVPARALIDGYGASGGDEVVEIHHGARPGELTARRWRLSA